MLHCSCYGIVHHQHPGRLLHLWTRLSVEPQTDHSCHESMAAIHLCLTTGLQILHFQMPCSQVEPASFFSDLLVACIKPVYHVDHVASRTRWASRSSVLSRFLRHRRKPATTHLPLVLGEALAAVIVGPHKAPRSLLSHLLLHKRVLSDTENAQLLARCGCSAHLLLFFLLHLALLLQNVLDLTLTQLGLD
jgi:hypothetical protein